MRIEIKDADDNVTGYIDLPDDATAEQIAAAQRAAVGGAPVQAEVFESVTPRQIRKALFMVGITSVMIEGALDSMEEPAKSLAKIEWEYAIEFKRDHPLVGQVALMLGWNDEQLNELWRTAASL